MWQFGEAVATGDYKEILHVACTRLSVFIPFVMDFMQMCSLPLPILPVPDASLQDIHQDASKMQICILPPLLSGRRPSRPQPAFPVPLDTARSSVQPQEVLIS